ncbi:unnamed protein product [Rotaria sp. Silwood1]|nr:unnamed protein product [Rotaria sp. Silwood1]CAF3494834.1 unnamed protein product [Rotaria sp. Silwood1]CAF4753421.1 unnamed protein product [Rotaria sp. Silwood1]CAF4937947.1 unnamed protein product [Rotaria sp. Silwood1]
MNEYEKAESYFQRLLQVLPVKHADRASIYDYMGTLNMRITNWKEALKNFNLAYEIKKKELHSNHRKIGRTLNGIGNYYKVIGDYFQAMIFYEKALQCQNDLCAKAVIQLNIGVIHSMNKDYDRALKFYFEARHILEQIHPCPHEEIAQCQAIIGNHYLTLKDYNTAEAYFHTTFEISKRILLNGDHIRIESVKLLADLYNKRGKNRKLLIFVMNNYLSMKKSRVI